MIVEHSAAAVREDNVKTFPANGRDVRSIIWRCTKLILRDVLSKAEFLMFLVATATLMPQISHSSE
ncbi:uncharacterized protein FOMMEDRAFT_168885 [Fomitiporia mediterranea MF3/22]|uniref:uncharacterized protein n=1 Tax=Fomitiporia mediterranea (strain MF3/22) TaxID=694068 RepID=UPI0004407D17|nr:uncharacterized protein FOMMEDRAFT_168885 [Fomitiporia mediterranea MF3/22]EJD02424.1 hypothetical protein FOMMEDRAFT_168885 [Fomitiporia mediterranea MF3/22]